MHDLKQNDFPFVTVIIPVYNDAKDLSLCLDALEGQTYPKNKFEVIVIDNGSTDQTIEVANSYPSVKVLIEKDYQNSPYSARNRGIEQAKGEILIFLDASCTPVHHWMIAGVKAMNQKNADMIGGHVSFRFQDVRSAAEFYDSQINIRMKENIEEKKGAKTANLFVRREVINTIGKFPEGIRSGGDLLWTQKATSQGFLLLYNEDASVQKSARPFKELLRKQWRVGKKHPQIWKEQGKKKSMVKIIVTMLIPPSPVSIMNMLSKSGKGAGPDFLRLWVVAYVVKIVTSLANIYGKTKL